MNFSVDNKIFEDYPDLKIGVLIVKGIDNSRRISSIESLLRGICAQKEKQFANKDLNEEPAISVWNQAYGSWRSRSAGSL